MGEDSGLVVPANLWGALRNHQCPKRPIVARAGANEARQGVVSVLSPPLIQTTRTLCTASPSQVSLFLLLFPLLPGRIMDLLPALCVTSIMCRLSASLGLCVSVLRYHSGEGAN